ncbi:MAG: methyl-accepting chemotaxis protein [Beijerinckiaceae bacterium]|jgi:methyl-accepting chemotaxis protein
MFFSLKSRILLAFGAIMAMLIVSTLINVTLLSGVGSDVAAFRSTLDGKSQAVDIDLTMQKVRVRVNQWLRSMNPTFAHQADELLATDAALIAKTASNVRSDKQKQVLADIDQALTAYIESWRVIQGIYAEEAKIYSERLMAPSAGIRAELAKVRDHDTIEPRTSRLISDARDGFMSAEASALRFRVSMKQEDADQVTAALSSSLSALEHTSAMPDIGPDDALIKQAAVAIGAWRDAFDDVVKLGQTKFARLTSWTNKEGEAMATGASALRSEGESAAAAGQAEVDSTISHSALAQYVLSAIILLMGVGLSLFMANSITRPLKRMTEALKMLAAGDRDVAIPETGRHDEIGEMAKAAQVFKDAAIDKQRIEEDALVTRRSRDEERSRAEITRAELQSRQQAVVTALALGLDRMSKGDLTGRLDQAFDAEYEKLRADFNATAASLEEALRGIVKASEAIGVGSDEISQASDDLSRRTEQQAASLEETAAALNVITATVQKMASGTDAAASVVATTRGAAQSSGLIVQEAIEAMGKIKESSTQISNIIGVIDEIAFQTNLLALNAGVEAARAGEAGRGFAVVASEVRGLAQRSAEAAKEIKALISASTTHVESGVVLVGKTGEALRGIIEKVSDMDALVRDIAASSQEQATGLAEVNVAVSQMDQVVQRNAAMVEESTAATHALKGESQGLADMVARFRINGEARGNPVHAARGAVVAAFARR